MTDPRLLVPATSALLAGWCGPVVVDGEPSIANDGEVFHPTDGRWWAWENWTVRLDLARSEAADRAARVLAEVSGIPGARDGSRWVWLGGREWELSGDRHRGQIAGSPPLDHDRRRFVPELSDGMVRTARARCPRLWVAVLALAALDPADDTLLPDGSRWVDRAALAECLRHITGGCHG